MNKSSAGAQSRGLTAAAPAFVGRDRELARIVDALAGPAALVLVEGEAGVGKTRLVREALATVADRTVLVAACPPLREPFPVGPVVDGVRRLHPQIGDLELSPLAGALRPVFPEWSDQLPPALEPLDDPAETRHRLLSALTELVAKLGVDLLVVEDAHWADTATLQWLLAMAASGDLDMSVVVTYRPTDVPDGSLLLALTSRPLPDVTRVRVELEPLDREQSRHLVGSMLATDKVSDDFAAFLYERTDGLPLALEETIRLLRERHDIIRQHGSWTRKVLDELQVPPTLRDSVLERVERLDPDTRRVLQAAAVVADPADEPLLTAVADLDDQGARHGIAGALASGLLLDTGGGGLVFRHALDAQAVDEAIPSSERRRLHQQAAITLRDLDPPPVVRLARHYREAGDTDQWCGHGEASADLAWESGDDRAAATTLLELLTSIDHTPSRRARLARKLGEATVSGPTSLADLAPRVSEVLREALSGEDLAPRDCGQIRFLLGRLLMQLAEHEAAFAQFEAAIPDLSHQPALAARAMLYLALPVTPGWPAARHLEWMDEAAALFPVVEPQERLSLTIRHATGLLFLGEEAGWQAAENIPQWAPTDLLRTEIVIGMLNVAQFATVWGHYEDARLRLDSAADLMRETGVVRGMDTAGIASAHLDYYMGIWDRGAEAAGELSQSEDAQQATRLEARVLRGLFELVRGERRLAERQLRDVSEDLARRGQFEPFLFPTAALARISLADGAIDEALQVIEPDVAMVARKGVWVWATDIATAHLDALVAAGKVDAAEDIVAQFADGLVGRKAPAPAAALATCRAILAEAYDEPGEASGLFAEAAVAWAVLPRPYDELLARERQGRCLLATDDHEEGLAVLSEAEQRLRELGAKWDADRVAHLLREQGVEVARAWKGGRRGYGGQLSPRELEVVALVAKGMSNKQIAEALYISPRTVTRHLSTAMRKLNVSSRTALAMTATETGLLSGEMPE